MTAPHSFMEHTPNETNGEIYYKVRIEHDLGKALSTTVFFIRQIDFYSIAHCKNVLLENLNTYVYHGRFGYIACVVN